MADDGGDEVDVVLLLLPVVTHTPRLQRLSVGTRAVLQSLRLLAQQAVFSNAQFQSPCLPGCDYGRL